MKLKLSFLAVLFTLYQGSNLIAQNYRNALTANPLGFLFTTANVQYEGAISGENSYAARINFYKDKITGDDVSSFGFGGAYRWYLPPWRALNGLWVAPSMDILFAKWKHAGEEISQTFFNINGEVGYKFFFEQIVVEPSFALIFSIGKAEYTRGRPNVTLNYGNGINFTFSLSLGYSW